MHRTNFLDDLKKMTIKLVVERFIIQVNRILSGKNKVATNPVETAALEFRTKNKNIGKFIPSKNI